MSNFKNSLLLWNYKFQLIAYVITISLLYDIKVRKNWFYNLFSSCLCLKKFYDFENIIKYFQQMHRVNKNTVKIFENSLKCWSANFLNYHYISFFHEKNLKHSKIIFLINFIFALTFFSYRFLPNLKKLCDSSKLRITFSWKRFSTT